jgi:hypothetical protein
VQRRDAGFFRKLCDIMFWEGSTPSLANDKICHKTDDGQGGERCIDANAGLCSGG